MQKEIEDFQNFHNTIIIEMLKFISINTDYQKLKTELNNYENNIKVY